MSPVYSHRLGQQPATPLKCYHFSYDLQNEGRATGRIGRCPPPFFPVSPEGYLPSPSSTTFASGFFIRSRV